jgi:hypothetical protein
MPEMMEGASPNYDEICGVMEDRLVPVFELLGDRLKGFEEDIAELKDIVFKIVSGFGDAVTEHKKGTYSEMLSGKYGPDIDEIKGPYSDIYGKDIGEELVDKLLRGEMDEGGVPEFLGGIKAKFGKIRMPAPDGEPVKEEITVENAPAEMKPENQPEEAPKEEAPKAEEESKRFSPGVGGDILDSMTNVLKQGPQLLKGRKRSA